MLELTAAALSLDPTLLDMAWTIAIALLLLVAGALSLAMLPWTDEELVRVDQSFRSLWILSPKRVPVTRA